LKLRSPYQVDCKSAIVKELGTGNSTLVVLPTGCGKTVLAAEVIKHFTPARSLFLAHRDTLIYQARKTIELHTGLSCGIEMASMRANGDMFRSPDVVISTVQTQLAGRNGDGRMTQFDPNEFGLLIVDEAHHYVSPSWKRVLDYYRKNPKLKVLGITATPDRADEKALGQIFETVAYDYEILDAIHDGWLVPIMQQMVKIEGLDFSQVKITAGDLNGAQLARVMEAEKVLQGIAGASIEIVGNRRAIVFTASVAHAEMTANILNRHRSGMADWVCDKTDKGRRQELLREFACGKVQVICNCGILTEGFDDPGVHVCIMARPTLSRSLYAQMIGRTTRALAGVVDGPETPELRKSAIAASAKPFAIVVDFTGNSGRHKLVTSADILGGKVSPAAIERAVRKAKEDGEPVRMDELLDRSEEELRQEAEKRRLEEEALKIKLVAKVQYRTQTISPFDAFDIQPVKERGWHHGKHLSDKQSTLLLKQGIDPASLSYVQAKQVLRELFSRWDKNLCSFKQAAILKKRGYDTHCGRAEASAIIDIISAREGWPAKKPVAA
jgi:superfamily II DNA or RNA helicase